MSIQGKVKSRFPFLFANDVPELVMLIGLPGSGKSYYAAHHCKNHQICSSDSVRKALYGSEKAQGNAEDVFQILHKNIIELLKSGKSCVYDATNIHSKRRKAFLDSIKNLTVRKRAVVIATPFECCRYNNWDRERSVPFYVLDRMYKQFDMPYYGEGWDKIDIYYPKVSYKSSYGSVEFFLKSVKYYEQNNPHHTLTLGSHCMKVGDSLKNFPVEVYEAGYLHDCGKPYCQTTDKDNPKISHYYNHEKVGCYNSLFYKSKNNSKRLERAVLIRYHMEFLQFNLEKRKEILGDNLYEMLTKLVHADLQAV